mmetsp:Transcript_103496/g.301994  ORF Transcript_103496/g.301994 Transcript_103496/m.301994 type:complete len:149 (-) Transcript_103496:40-486(-)
MARVWRAPWLCLLLALGLPRDALWPAAAAEVPEGDNSVDDQGDAQAEPTLAEEIAAKEESLRRMVEGLRAIVGSGSSATRKGVKTIADAMESALTQSLKMEGSQRLELLEAALAKRADFARSLSAVQERLEDEGRRDGPFSADRAAEM